MVDWRLEWPEGSCEVHAAGGQTGKTFLRVGPSLWANPFHEPPWAGKDVAHESRLTENMHGDYACVGLGMAQNSDGLPDRWRRANDTPISVEDGLVTEDDWLSHGYGAHHDWHLVSQSPRELRIAIDYPESSAVSRLERTRGIRSRQRSDWRRA